MQEIPLHPAIVHLPIGLAMVVPFFAIALAFGLWRGLATRRAWLVVIVLQIFLLVGGLVAMEAGEDEAERVEQIVGEEHIEEHEERAEVFVWASGVVLAVAVAVLFLPAGKVSAAAAALAAAGTLVVATAGYFTGHSGGELVYVHGAASAYAEGRMPAEGGGSGGSSRADDD